MTIQPLNQCDFYKTNHYGMYPDGTSEILSNLTPRKSRMSKIREVVIFGNQYTIKDYLIRQWNENFFKKPKAEVIAKYKRMMDYTLGKDTVDMTHIEKLWDLGYMPLEIRSLPEGSICPIGVPCMTIRNTVPHAYWLVNYLETILSCLIWQPITSATIGYNYRKLATHWALKTTGNATFVMFQCHDFSMRGMSSLETACLSAAGHLLSFYGTDTVPAIEFLETYYNANIENELVGTSVPATEHSVMCMGTKDNEIGTIQRLLTMYPKGYLSIVSDTWDLWEVVRPGGFCEQLKEQILSRDGKLVIRPDSGDPVDILCGIKHSTRKEEAHRLGVPYFDGTNVYNVDAVYDEVRDSYYDYTLTKIKGNEYTVKGVVQLLWEVFGGETVTGGDGNTYKVLDSHIGVIYGDSITIERAEQIFERLAAKGFASSNVVLGIGSYTYQYNTRDTFGFAVKATYGEVIMENGDIDCREIFKDPITDDGTKKSAKGMVMVKKHTNEDGSQTYKLVDQVTREEFESDENCLIPIFRDGQLLVDWTLAEIRARLHG